MIYRSLLAEQAQALAMKSLFTDTGKENQLSLLNSVRGREMAKGDATIIIGGGGIAGLCSAYELKNRGFKVVLLEAQKDHIGGRARTHRISEDIYGEFGAMRIPEIHYLTRHYVAEFNLALRPFINANPNAIGIVRGNRFKIRETEEMKTVFNLTPKEIQESTFDFWKKSIKRIADSLTERQKEEIFKKDIIDPLLKRLDKKSLYEVLRESNLSKEAQELLVSTWTLETSLQISLFEILREEINGTWAGKFDEIIGGTDLLPKAFYEKIRQDVTQDAIITKVIQKQESVTVIYKNSSGQQFSVSGDWFICTIPLGPIQRVSFEPPLSFPKCRAIRRVHYDSSTKILSLTNRRFWEIDDNIFGGGSFSDNIFGSTWYPSDNLIENKIKSTHPSMFLASYSWGQAARRIDGIPQSELKHFVIDNLKKLHPNLKDNSEDIQSVIRWSWTNYKWSLGAYAYFKPEEHSDLYRELIEPEGRILLAGEHTSLTHSWMQGAIESALTTVDYILSCN